MPWIVTSYKSRHVKKPHRMKATFLFTETEIERLAAQPDHCYTIVNTTSRLVSKVGGACRKATPAHLRGSFLEKLFGKKKPKRNPMSRRMYFVPGAGKNPMARRGELVTMQGARRRRKRRRR